MMERLREETQSYPNVDYLALCALVDALFAKSDARAFELLNKILEKVRGQ